MKIFFNKKIISKIISGLLIITFVFPAFTVPKKARAIGGVGDVVLDPTNLVQTTVTATNTGITSASSLSIQLKEYVLDGLGTMLLKQIIRQITNSVVNWINSGFEGSPSFLSNPGSFFLDAADQITGDFIARYGGPLQDLCSPFSIDIRLALAFKYRPNSQQRYACTLGTIIQNSKNAVENASINGFTAGDFRQGGWPAFVSLTTEPQNNIYGAYLQADSELSWKVASAQVQQKEEISAGRGFLSWRDPECVRDVKKYNDKIKSGDISEDDRAVREVTGGSYSSLLRDKNDCPVKTPGTVIVDSLEANVNGPLHELQLADELGEIVNALFAQLATQILQKGLSSVSQKNVSGSSYLDRTVADLNNEDNPQVQNVKAELIRNVEGYKKTTLEYKQLREEAFKIMLDIKNIYDTARACLVEKAGASNTSSSSSNKQRAQQAVEEIDNILSTRVSTKTLNLFSLVQEADARLKTLQDIQDKASAAKTLNDLNGPSQQYSQMIQSRSLTNPVEIQNAKDDLTTIKTESADLQQDAMRKNQLCQLL